MERPNLPPEYLGFEKILKVTIPGDDFRFMQVRMILDIMEVYIRTWSGTSNDPIQDGELGTIPMIPEMRLMDRWTKSMRTACTTR